MRISENSVKRKVKFAEFSFRDCPKRVGGACGVTLRSTSTVLFDPFWPPCASQIHAHSVALTPFRTVSLGTWPNKGKMSNCRGLYLILLYSSLSLSLSLSIRLLSSFLHCLQRARPFPYLQDSLWGPRQTVDLPSQGDMKDDE